jgi:hypothetical protein
MQNYTRNTYMANQYFICVNKCNLLQILYLKNKIDAIFMTCKIEKLKKTAIAGLKNVLIMQIL